MSDAPNSPTLATIAAAGQIVARAEAADGHPPLSDQLRTDLADGTGLTLLDEHHRGFAHVAQRPDGWTMQVVVDPPARSDDRTVARSLAAAAVGAVAARGGGRIDWWAFAADRHDDEAAESVGFALGRRLLQMRRQLPAEFSADVETRPFRPGVDDAAWVEVNNRAFAGHPEQGNWTVETLERRTRENWFDAAGLRLYELDGRLAAFCWTKIHVGEPGLPARAGEIYVIGVDPDFQGRRLGRQLTLAGLDAITAAGVADALLYVDAANESAVALYDKLGFRTHRADHAYVRTVP